MTGYPSIDKPWLKYYSDETLAVPLPKSTMYECLYSSRKNHPDEIAINYLGRRITNSALLANIDAARNAFGAMGIRREDVVTFCTLNTPEMVYCTYALNSIGAVANFEYPTLSEQELISSMNGVGSRTLFLLDVLAPRFPSISTHVENLVLISPADSLPLPLKLGYKVKSIRNRIIGLSYGEFMRMGRGCHPQQERIASSEAPALIVHTGGSTGAPKAVLLSNDSLNCIAHEYRISGMQYARGDTLLHCIPPFHAYGFSVGVHMPLCLGMTICMSVKIDTETMSSLFVKNIPNHFVGSGPHVAAIIENKRVQEMSLSQLKTIAIGGAAVNEVDENKANVFLSERGAPGPLLVGYGMTETCATSCTNTNFAHRVGTVGIPLPHVVVKIIDVDNGEECTYGQQGELHVNSPCSMVRYLNNEHETNKCMYRDDEGLWIRTGDLASVDESGFVTIRGRLKRVCTTRDPESGCVFKLYPDYIEKIAGQIDGVKECAITTVPDDNKVNVAVAFVALNGPNNMVEDLKSSIAERLPAHAIPVLYQTLDKMPRTPVGKIDYRALEQKAAELVKKAR